jgi:uncharacterized membrane protein
VRWTGFVSLALIVAGVALLVAAVASGSASLALVVIVPVLTGRSLVFLAGALLLIVGLFTLPLAGSRADVDGRPGRISPAEETETGGLILIGPIPIFFGHGVPVSRRARVVAAVVGGVALAVAIVALVWVGR